MARRTSAGDRGGEVENPVVVARRVTDEHVGEQPFGDARRVGIGDVVGAELAATEVAERHVVAEDLELRAVRAGDHVERHM